MKAYLGITFHHNKQNRESIKRISQVLAECGFETVCVCRDIAQWEMVALSPRELMTATFDAIRSCQLMVIDIGILFDLWSILARKRRRADAGY